MTPEVRTIDVCEVTAFGGPEVLRPAKRPWPVRHDDEIVVKIAAANVNPTDLSGRSGAHRSRMPELQPPFVLGWDLAGVVAEVPARSSRYSPGDAVVGMIPWVRIAGRTGAYAQAAAVRPEWLAPSPEGLEDIIAATVPLNALTAQQALHRLDLQRGQTLLITGASGAVGSFAVQLAAQDGLRVLALASEGDEAWVAGLGATRVLPRSPDFTTVEEVDALLDAVPIGAKATAAVKSGGVALFTRRVEVAGRPDLRVETPLVNSDAPALAELTAKVAAGTLKTRVAHILPLAHAAEAHRLVALGGLRGKVVLTTGG